MKEDWVRRPSVKRVTAPFSDHELTEIDDWGFAQRIRDRSEAIRALVRRGLDTPKREMTTAG